ncbi:Cyclophilin type peptidyl-prolyl cis-trans isomerase/CLD [Gracilaria domingensis]|nr:Cyclophilin type peptidyl-prolyl cis-trans isomerase/CLD [Gracilaria domingensis]
MSSSPSSSPPSPASSPSPLGPAQPPPPPSPPRKRRRLEQVAQARRHGASLPLHLPKGPSYQRSYMMRRPVQCLFTSSSSITVASLDASLTFWARSTSPPGSPSRTNNRSDVQSAVNSARAKLHFVKRLLAHKAPLLATALSRRADQLLTTSATDGTLKLFSTPTFELLHVLSLSFDAGPVLLHIELQSTRIALVSHRKSPNVACFTLPELQFRSDLTSPHAKPLSLATYNHTYSAVISIDEANVIDYWAVARTGTSYQASVDIPQLQFRSKLRTHLFYFARNALVASALNVSPRGSQFVVVDQSCRIHIFQFLTGLRLSMVDLSLTAIRAAVTNNEYETFGLNNQHFEDRLACETLLRKHEQMRAQNNVVFDETGQYVLYATVLGIHMIHVSSTSTVFIFGLNEHRYRFVNVSICAADTIDRDNGIPTSLQPLVVASAFDSQRIFLFGAAQVSEKGRDVMNEPLYTASQSLSASPTELSNKKLSPEQLPKRVTLHTSLGDIMLQLFAQQAPKTVQNFTTHARNGYYDGVIFHRVIRGFMVQSGDPDGDGTGGESIWGAEFEDEINPSLEHEVGSLSMANAGPNTNGSVSHVYLTCFPTLELLSWFW